MNLPVVAFVRTTPMAWIHRLSGLSFALIAAFAAVLTAGFWPGDLGWVRAGAGASLLFGLHAVCLWRRLPWAKPVGVGMLGFSLGVWTQSLIALGFCLCGGESAKTSAMTAGVAIAGSAAALLLLLAVPGKVATRHGLSTAFAGASIVPAVVFALVPGQTIAIAVAMAFGSLALVAGAIALGGGRTWGLLVNVVGAGIVGVGVAYAPWVTEVSATNAWLPNLSAFLPIVLGLSAAVPAMISTAFYAGPLVRFIARG